MTNIEDFVTTYEHQEKNLIDFEDIRFGEIYLDDQEEQNYDD